MGMLPMPTKHVFHKNFEKAYVFHEKLKYVYVFHEQYIFFMGNCFQSEVFGSRWPTECSPEVTRLRV